MLRAFPFLLLVLGRAASLRPSVRAESRRSVVGAAAGLLLPHSFATASWAEDKGEFNEFRADAKAEMKAQKEAAAKRAAMDEATGAKAAAALEAKAAKTKAPLNFDEMLRNSISQREAETGMSMSQEDIDKLTVKLKKAFPGVV
mmetsp:Transcript_14026/g.28447  ORF Transcript_14026/g.28447 Transcript_14026/m.28447 type:complete len:144 (-) Transcript_14026:167-598(-)